MALEKQGKSELATKYRENIENYKNLKGKFAGFWFDHSIRQLNID